MTKVAEKPLLLVLDDYQSIDQSGDASTLIQTLITEAPSLVHFVILSRSVPSLPLGKLRAQQQLCELGGGDLALTPGETADILLKASQELTHDQIALIHERMEGWVAGVATVCQSLRYGRKEQVMQLLSSQPGSSRLVYDYLAQEVFGCQDTETQAFLMKTSILTRLGDDACNELLQTSTSLGKLMALERDGLFITPVNPERHTFRYHQLFAGFLRQRLYEQEGPAAVLSLHGKAAAFYESRSDWESCVHHFLAAGDASRAAEIIERVGERHIFSGLAQTVGFWLRSLPDDLVSGRPWLLALRGRLAHMSSRHSEARASLERAHQQFRASGDQRGQAWTVGELAYVDYRCGRLAQSIHGYREALSHAEGGAVLKSQLLVMQAMPLRDVGAIEPSIEGCRASLHELLSVDDEGFRSWGQSRATRNLALALAERGDLDAARAASQEALAICREHQLGEYEEGWDLMDLGIVMFAQGDLMEAVQTFERAMAVSARHDKYQQQILGQWWGNCLRDLGRMRDAREVYGMGDEAAALEGVFADILDGRGKETLSRVEDLYARLHKSERMDERVAAQVVFAAALRVCGDARRALSHATRAVEVARSCGCRQRLASALLHKARLEYEVLTRNVAETSLREAFELARSGHYFHFYWWDPELVAFLCAQAMGEGVEAGYAGELLSRRPDLPRAAVATPLLQSRRARVRQLGMAVLGSAILGNEAGEAGPPLSRCGDPVVRHRLAKAVADQLISREGVDLLLTSYELSWREVDVFVQYYLRLALQVTDQVPRWRSICAAQMGLSEHTLRCHINSVRRKLRMQGPSASSQLLAWATAEGVLPPASLALGYPSSAISDSL